MISCVYTITNRVNGKIYVGKTNNFNYRVSKHLYTLRNKTHINSHLQRAWDKYGEDNFTFEILEEYSTDLLFAMEHYWCNILDVFNYNRGYNIKPAHPENKGGNSQEMSEKVRIANTGKKATVEARKKMSERKIGRKLSIQTRKRMSKAALGKPKSQETRNKISEAKKGVNNPMYGKIPWNKKII